MGRARTYICLIAAAVALLALALPAGVAAKSRIVLCLQGKANCSGSSKVETEVPAPVTDIVLGQHGKQSALENALYLCSAAAGNELTRSLQEAGVDGFICREEGHWSFGFAHKTGVNGVATSECHWPRTGPDGQEYRSCDLAIGSSSGPYVKLDRDLNWPWPVEP